MKEAPAPTPEELAQINDPVWLMDLYGFRCYAAAQFGLKLPDPNPWRERMQELLNDD